MEASVIFIFCKFNTAVTGSELVRLAEGATLGRALERLRQEHRAGVAVHHPHFGKQLFYSNGWHSPALPLMTA
jgi:hypothetical protein